MVLGLGSMLGKYDASWDERLENAIKIIRILNISSLINDL